MGHIKNIFLLFIFLLHSPTIAPREYLLRSAQDNLHEVEKNTFYRSRQLTPKRLLKFIKKLGIKTIINLRGVNKDKSWWVNERDLAKEYKVNFFSIPMSAQRLPHRNDLIKLLYLYKYAPRPILVHCMSGADRAGEASALWVLDQQKKSKKEALRQLSFKYGHFSFYRPSKHYFIKLWKGRKWALTSYNPFNHPKHYKFK